MYTHAEINRSGITLDAHAKGVPIAARNSESLLWRARKVVPGPTRGLINRKIRLQSQQKRERERPFVKRCAMRKRERERKKERAKGEKERQNRLVAIVGRVNNADGTRFCALYCRRGQALRAG